MSYGVKYRLDYKDLLGVSKRMDILEEDYAGSVIDVIATRNPVIFAWNPDESHKYPQLIASSCDIFLRSPERKYFIDLFTSSKFKYKVQYFVGSTWLWSGYVIADLYSEPYSYKNYEVNIKATDGIGLLKNIPFTLTGVNTDFDIILHCLNKLNHGIDIYTAVHLFETRMDGVIDPLKQAYTDCALFSGMKCAEVLRAILISWGAILYQDNNTWNVVRMSQHVGKNTYKRTKYNYEGTKLSTEIKNPIVNLTDHLASAATRNVMLSDSTRLNIVPGGKELLIEHDYGINKNLLLGGDCSIGEFTVDGDDLIANHWERINHTGETQIYGTITESKNQQCFFSVPVIYGIPGFPNLAAKATTLKLLSDTKLIFIKFVFRIWVEDSTTNEFIDTTGDVLPGDVFIELKKSQGSNHYYLTNTGWQLNPLAGDQLYSLGTIGSSIGWNERQIIAEGIPDTGTPGTIEIYIRPPVNIEVLGRNTRLDVKQIFVQLNNYDDNALESGIEFITEINDGHNIILDEIEVFAADVPDITNAKAIYSNKKALSDESPTKLWQESGSTLQESMIVSLARIITDQYARPTISYDALIRHPHLSFGNVIWDPFDEMKYRILEISSYNDADCVMSLKVVEIVEPDVPAPVAPLIESAEVPFLEPTKILLTFDQDIDEEFKPATTAFAVSDNTVSSVTMNDNTVLLTLGSALEDGAFTVTYTKPTTNALVSAAYFVEVASFVEGGTYVEPVPATCGSAYLQEGEDDIIELYFSANLNDSKVPQISSFTITDNTIGAVSITDNLVILTLGAPQPLGDNDGVFTVSYVKPGANPLTGVDGAQVASFDIEGSI